MNEEQVKIGIPAMTPAEIQNHLFQSLDSQEKHLTNSTELLNKTSTDYRTNLIAINDKLILVAVGSASLFITFLGVIFNSNKDTAALDYKFFVFSIAGLLLTCLSLLISRWASSLHIFNTVHKYYLLAMESKTKTQVKIIEKSPSGIDQDTYEFFSGGDLDKEVKEGKLLLGKIGKQIKLDEVKELLYDRLSVVMMLLGYIALATAYVFALLFFSGIISIMNGLA